MKQGILVMWAVLIGGVIFGSGWVAGVAKLAFWGIALLHVLEFVAKRGVMEKAGGSMGQHFVKTLIYGLFHWKPLEEQQATTGAEDS